MSCYNAFIPPHKWSGLSARFTVKEINLVQEAVDNSDISFCMDVIDKIDDYLEEYKSRKKKIEQIDDQLYNLWNKYLDSVKNINNDFIISIDGRWKELDESKDLNPVFYAVEYNEKVEEHLMKLRDSILDLF